ncbi:MAG TPA: hypothetical protein VJV03_11430 [Pyrinomonadaceae bacterium]|nr:hypothetical protein [Pyrinomonadaceae bacterium]
MSLTPKLIVACAVSTFAMSIVAQSNNNQSLPKEVRGYKVHRAEVELKKTESKKDESGKSDSRKRRTTDEQEYQQDEPLLVRLGEPKLVSVSPLGVTFDVPVIIGAIKQEGEVDRLVFDDMRVNDIAVTIDDYAHKFKLPNKEPLTLQPSLRIFVSTPQAVLRTIDELLNSKETWPVTGRVYVCGHFKRFLFKFKRAVPVELDTSIKNPVN